MALPDPSRDLLRSRWSVRFAETYGNGLVRSHGFDTSGRLTGIEVATGSTVRQDLAYTFNDDDSIHKITNGVTAALTQTFAYDALVRLTGVTATGANQGFAYDANGNRTSHIRPAGTDTYSLPAASNRLAAITGPGATSYSYDARGNTTAGGGNTYGYDSFNRLDEVTRAGVTTNYRINALGQRVRKDQGTSATRVGFVYGPSGQVEAEYGWGGAGWTYYLRLPGGEPVGLVRGGQVYMVHTDHLGRPEVATDATKSVVWRASNYAFDRTVTTDTIGGLNLGFPGQYWDAESGLWYNHFRSYDPKTGRYIESDPIGLAGGLNTYGYVFGNPITYVDPLGLESPGSFNNGGHQLTWERGSNARMPDYVRIQVSFYVFNASRTFSRSGNMYVAGGFARGYPAPPPKVQASISFGWLNQCEIPEGSQVDDFLSGYGMAGAAGYKGVGGGVTWSPGFGTATEVGIGIGGGVSPGEVGVQDGTFGGGW